MRDVTDLTEGMQEIGPIGHGESKINCFVSAPIFLQIRGTAKSMLMIPLQ